MKNSQKISIFMVYFFSSFCVLAMEETSLDQLDYSKWGNQITVLLDDKVYANKRKNLIYKLEENILNQFTIKTPRELLAFYLVHHAMDLSSEHTLAKDAHDMYWEIRSFYLETHRDFAKENNEDERFNTIVDLVRTSTEPQKNSELFPRMRILWQLAYNTLDPQAKKERTDFFDLLVKKLNKNKKFENLSRETVLDFIGKNTWDHAEYQSNEKIISLKRIITTMIEKMNILSTEIK